MRLLIIPTFEGLPLLVHYWCVRRIFFRIIFSLCWYFATILALFYVCRWDSFVASLYFLSCNLPLECLLLTVPWDLLFTGSWTAYQNKGICLIIPFCWGRWRWILCGLLRPFFFCTGLVAFPGNSSRGHVILPDFWRGMAGDWRIPPLTFSSNSFSLSSCYFFPYCLWWCF